MSYDISLTIDTGGEQRAEVCDVGNMTSNVSPMWRVALGFPLADFHGMKAEDCVEDLERATHHIRSPEHAFGYEKLNPINGWGDHASAADYLDRLLAACRAHPKAIVRISR